MINVKAIGKKKKNGDGKSSSFWGVGFANGNITVNNDEVQGVNIWGQYHDHSGDVNGDMQVDGNINSTGNLSVNSATVQNNLEVGGNISANAIEAETVESDTLTTHDLVVTGNAHFFNLTIDEIKSVGGQIILSAANATIDRVDHNGNEYELIWKKTDGSKGIDNMFRVNDQIICQTFNKTDVTGQNVTNKYYWALVTGIGDNLYTIDGEEVECHYIIISTNTYDGTSVPEAGDKICQLGYRGTDDNARQSAIILSAYQSPDPNVTAPSMVQYEGINTFSLDGKAVNVMSHGNNTFTGNFRVVSNGTTTNIVDLINGQQPQVITDSEQSWIMSDADSKTYALTDYQNLPTNVKVYLGNDIIPLSQWTSGSTITVNNRAYNIIGSFNPNSRNGLNLSALTKNTNDLVLTWSYQENTSYNPSTGTYTNNGTVVANSNIAITVNFVHNGTTYTAQKTVPMNVIKASVSTQGADAEFDKLLVDKLDFNVTIDNELTCDVIAKVYHIKGNTVTQLTDLSNYTANLLLSNGSTVTVNKGTTFTKSGVINSNYTGMTNPPTSVTLRLFKNSTLVDEETASIKFNAGSVFTLNENAISAAVQQSNGYTDSQVAQVQLTADGLATRVTNIENDYVTSSELTQTANNIQLNVYDELKNKTGIDVSAGQITLNGNTIVNGNLTLTQSEQGFTLVGESGVTQIMPKSIGTYDEFTSLTTTTIKKEDKTNGVETQVMSEYHRYSFTTDFPIGTVKAGGIVSVQPEPSEYLKTYYLITMPQGTVSIDRFTEVSKQMVFLEDDEPQQTNTFTNGSVNYTSNGGNLTIRTIYTVDIPIYYFTNGGHDPWQIIKVNVTIPNDVFMLIGTDGIAVNFGTSATAYIGAEGTVIKYKERYTPDSYNTFKVNGDGIFVWGERLDDYIRLIANTRSTTT